MDTQLDNLNPVLHVKQLRIAPKSTNGIASDGEDECLVIPNAIFKDSCSTNSKSSNGAHNSLLNSYSDVDEEEIFNIIKDIKDPEYNYTLENLKIVELDRIFINQDEKEITVHFVPTVPHCSQATLIGLMILVKLQQSLPFGYRIDVQIANGTHNSEDIINKQLLDKERVAAALENPVLIDLINDGLYYNVNNETLIRL